MNKIYRSIYIDKKLQIQRSPKSHQNLQFLLFFVSIDWIRSFSPADHLPNLLTWLVGGNPLGRLCVFFGNIIVEVICPSNKNKVWLNYQDLKKSPVSAVSFSNPKLKHRFCFHEIFHGILQNLSKVCVFHTPNSNTLLPFSRVFLLFLGCF